MPNFHIGHGIKCYSGPWNSERKADMHALPPLTDQTCVLLPF